MIHDHRRYHPWFINPSPQLTITTHLSSLGSQIQVTHLIHSCYNLTGSYHQHISWVSVSSEVFLLT